MFALCIGLIAIGQPAWATPFSPVQNAAQVGQAHGDRTAVAVVDVTTGEYRGAGQDTGIFPSESVVKVFIAVRLLLTWQMSGATEATAYRMITASDDAAADALYGRAGGDAVVDLVGAHYGIPELGRPSPVPGRWGLTGITARGLVRFYAAVAKDPAVYPWLNNAMRHMSPTAADGTDQTFGLPAAAREAAVKQGWGHDGIDSGHAVVNSTGYLAGGRFAVAILTAGPPASYGAGLERVVTAQAQALVSGLRRADAARAAASKAPERGSVASGALGTAGEPPPAAMAAVGVLGAMAGVTALTTGAVRGGRRLGLHLISWRARRRARRRRAGPRPVRPHPLAGRLVRLPSGQVVRITAAPAVGPQRVARPGATGTRTGPVTARPSAPRRRPAARRWAGAVAPA